MSRFVLPIVLIVVLAGATLAGMLGSADGDPNLIRILSSLPRTGGAKAQTDTIVNGIKIALEESGYKAGKFTLEYADWDDATAGAGQWAAQAETPQAALRVC